MSDRRSRDEKNNAVQFRLGAQVRTAALRALIDELIAAVVPSDERPIVITDLATIFDITTLDEAEVASRCEAHYGRRPSSEELSYPVWRLAEALGRAKPSN